MGVNQLNLPKSEENVMNMIWKTAFLTVITGSVADVSSTWYVLRVLGGSEANPFAAGYVLTPLHPLIEVAWILTMWALPYALYRFRKVLMPTVAAPIACGIFRAAIGIRNILLNL